MENIPGFVFSQHTAIGTMSEGVLYYLQAYKEIFLITSDENLKPFQTDKILKPLVGKIIRAEGTLKPEVSIPEYKEMKLFVITKVEILNEEHIPIK